MIQLSEMQIEQFIRDGYVVVPNLLSEELVKETRDNLCSGMGIDLNDRTTWDGKTSFPTDLEVIATTSPARNADFESVAEQLVGKDFTRGVCFSAFLEWNHLPPDCEGYIPVITYPTPGEKLLAYGAQHIDGGKYVTTYPGLYFLAAMAYLSDVTECGGATVVRPGSHRQVFERWLANNHTPDDPFAVVPDLPYAESVPVVAKAGDVCFMHYLMVHCGSANRTDTLRVAMNTAVMTDPARPYVPKSGPPQPDWTPMDYTLRTDTL